MQIGPGRVQDGPKIVLVRSFFRLVLRDRFFGRLGVVLGSFLGAPGVVFVLFWAFQLIDSTHQLINSSIQRVIIPWPFGAFLLGPADCALRD